MANNIKYVEVLYAEIMHARRLAEAELEWKIKCAQNILKFNVLTIEQIAQGLSISVEDVINAKNTMDEQDSRENDK